MTDEPCSSPIHQWTPRRSTGSWFCTQCGLIVFHEPSGTGPDGRLPNGRLPKVRYHKGSGGFKTKHLSKLDLLQRLYARDGRRCWWCGRVLLAMDEIQRCGPATCGASSWEEVDGEFVIRAVPRINEETGEQNTWWDPDPAVALANAQAERAESYVLSGADPLTARILAGPPIRVDRGPIRYITPPSLDGTERS